MFCLLVVLVRLPVPVQVTDWKESSPKWPIMCWWVVKHYSLTHSPLCAVYTFSWHKSWIKIWSSLLNGMFTNIAVMCENGSFPLPWKVSKQEVWWKSINTISDFQDSACQKSWTMVRSSSSYSTLDSRYFGDMVYIQTQLSMLNNIFITATILKILCS